MISKMVITCTGCNKKSQAPVTLQGKKIKCKACGTVFTVPADKGAKAKEPAVLEVQAAEEEERPTVAAAPDDDEWSDANPYGISEMTFVPRCPHCANEMEAGDVVCLHCGYNIETRARHQVVKTVGHTAGDWFLWLAPGVLCVLTDFFLLTFLVLYHFMLPWLIFDKQEYGAWSKTLAESGRFAACAEDAVPWYSYMFHPGFETWMLIMFLFFGYKATRFAIKRLILHPTPPEKVKH
jgi:DNA-directed RNA polymerase subunit RPC12/RpoP